MLKAVNNLKFNVTERKLLDFNETYDEIQGDTKVVRVGKYYAVKDVDIKLLKGLCDFKAVTHRLNGVPTRCLFINAFLYKKI